jgi:hypothetical protein
MRTQFPALTIEQIDALEIPDLPVRRVNRDFYYPFFSVSWDEGKVAAQALGALPEWARRAFQIWMFHGIDRLNETVVISHGYKGTGKYVLEPKDGTVDQCIQRIAPLMQYAGTSSEQKQATVALLFYRLFNLTSEVEPEKRVWP